MIAIVISMNYNTSMLKYSKYIKIKLIKDKVVSCEIIDIINL